MATRAKFGTKRALNDAKAASRTAVAGGSAAARALNDPAVRKAKDQLADALKASAAKMRADSAKSFLKLPPAAFKETFKREVQSRGRLLNKKPKK